MKVLLLTSVDHPQVKYEAEALSKFDLDYVIIEFNRSDLPHALNKFFRNLPKLLMALIKLRIPPVPFRAFLRYLLISSFLLKKIKEKRYHLIYAHWLYPAGYVGLILSKILNCKVISVIWGYDIQVVSEVKNYGIGEVNRAISKMVLNKSDIIVVNQMAHKVIAERLSGLESCNKIIYIPLGIPDISIDVKNELTDELKEKLHHTELNKRNVILYSPSLRPLYGIWEFVNAIPLINATVDNCLFVIVGEGELKHYAIKFVKDNGLEDKVAFLGKISHESMKVLYKLSSVVCDLAYPG